MGKKTEAIHEMTLKDTVNYLKGQVEALNKGLQEIASLFDTVVEAIGEDKFKEAHQRVNIRNLESGITKQSQAVETALQANAIEFADVVTKDSILEVTQHAADGSQMYPSRIFIEFVALPDTVSKELEGAVKGETRTLSHDGTVVTVLNIYKRTPQPATSGLVISEESKVA